MDHCRSTPEHLTPSFEEFAKFIREWAGIPTRKQIAPGTLLEDDLGITGDDGCELLEETEKRFGVCLSSPEHGYRQTFGLGPNEFLFHSEGFGPDRSDVLSLFRESSHPQVVRRFSVADIFNAVKNAPAKHESRAPTPTSILGLRE
jgi:hypothetical protein